MEYCKANGAKIDYSQLKPRLKLDTLNLKEVQTMIIKRKEAKLILDLMDEANKNETKKAKNKEEQFETLDILEKMGLISLNDKLQPTLTFTGLRIATELQSLINTEALASPDEWEEDWRWIGSEVIAMLDAAKKGGRITEVSLNILKERGFATYEKQKGYYIINEAGKEILRIYRDASPMLEISYKLADYIRSIPSGPAYTSNIKINGYYEHLLESMRLIAYSVPHSEVYTFTALGQAVKNALELGGFVKDGHTFSTGIMLELSKMADGEDVSKEAAYRLQTLGYIDSEGNLLPAGEWVLEAYRLWKNESREDIWSLKITQKGSELLSLLIEADKPLGVEELEEKLKKIKPQKFKIKEYNLEEELMILEAFDLVEPAFSPEGKRTYKLTKYGVMAADDRRKKKSAVSSVSVKSITMTRKTFSAPNIEWFTKAKDEGLIGSREPTRSGYMYAFMAENIERKPHINRSMAELFKQIPERGKTTEDILSKANDETEKKLIAEILDTLEAEELIEILPDDNIILTDAGKEMKKALLATPPGFATPLTPDMCRVLIALFDVGVMYESEKKMRVPPKMVKDAIKKSSLSDKAFSDAFMACKQAGYTGLNIITEAGISAIKACKLANPDRSKLKGYSDIYEYKKTSLKEE